MNLSPDQAAVADKVENFIRDLRPHYAPFVLHGLAGTGKTTLWSHLVRSHRGATLVTPTGKAASVLWKRSGLKVSTIHSVIYDFRGLVDDEEDERKKNPIFVDKEGLNLEGQLVFLDECSMVGKRLAEALLSTGATVIACGDPGQLPPVNDAAFFVEPSAMLKEVHRQALESPIIRQAHNIRHNGFYETDGENFRVVPFAEPEMILEADICLCFLNVTRKKLNQRKRQLLNLEGPLHEGEPVMCLKNNHTLGIYNGAVYTMARDRGEAEHLTLYDDDGQIIFVSMVTIEGEKRFDVKRYDDKFTPFAPAYACTVHKAQGSEFPSVLLFDEKPRGAERVPFLYTGITRAVERCTVVSWR